MSHYDVIVIGSGAGGGTLVHRLAPSGKQVLLLERGDWLPREPQNWSAADVFVDNRYVSPDTWYDEHGKPFQPQVHYFVGGATKLYGAALYRLREEDFGELDHHDGTSPAWPVGYDEFEPYYTQAEQLYQVHGARGEDPTEPHASAPYPHPAVSHEPRIQQLSDDLAAAGLHPFHAPCGVMLDEADTPHSRCVRCATCDGFPCLVHAKSDAEVLAVRPALDASERDAAHRARGRCGWRPNAAGTAVTGVVVERDGERRRSRPTSSSSPAAPRTRPRCCCPRPTPRTRTGSPTRPTRSGATTCSTTARPCSRCRRRRTRRSSRRRSGSTTSTSASDELRVPAREHPDGRQVLRRHVPRREAAADQARAAVDAGEGRPPRGRLLALHRGPAAAGEPRHAAPRREHPARVPADQPGAQGAAARRAQGAAQAHRRCTSTT